MLKETEMTTKTSGKDETTPKSATDKTSEKKQKEKPKFIGGYLEWELVNVLKQDADMENRTASKHMEFLVLLGLKARGHDISRFTKIGLHSRDFVLMDEFLAWKKKNGKD